MEKAIDLSELRSKIDRLNEKLLGGISTRLKYPLNSDVFDEEFFEGKSWFLHRLKKEQDLDSEFGRFLYHDQVPFLFKKSELAKAKISAPKNKGVTPIEADFSEKVIVLYRKLIEELCENKENDKGTFGETTKLDVENILTLNERTVGLGEQVAAFKLQTEPEIKKLKNAQEIRNNLIKPEREVEVVNNIIITAKKYGITNDAVIINFAKELIQITLDSEVYFILNSK